MKDSKLARPDAAILSARTIPTLLRDLGRPRRPRYWVDLAVSYCLMILGLVWTSRGGLGLVGLLVAIPAAYRSIAFVHEVTHQGRRRLGLFANTWDLLVGVPFLLPQFIYGPVHLDHHKARIYGTREDGEYIRDGHRLTRTAAFLVGSLSLPFFLWLRFAVLGPLSWLHPRLRRAVWRRCSQLAITGSYVNPEPDERGWHRLVELCASAYAVSATAAVLFGFLPLGVPLVWLGVTVGVLALSGVRDAVSHSFHSDGRRMDRIAAYLDSLTVEGNWQSELWAPLGLRFHALHHLCPNLPYHDVARAHRRLMRALPRDSFYQHSVEPSLGRAMMRRVRESGARRSVKSIYRFEQN